MNNLLSHSGLFDARISASEKDLPVGIMCLGTGRDFIRRLFPGLGLGLALGTYLVWGGSGLKFRRLNCQSQGFILGLATTLGP